MAKSEFTEFQYVIGFFSEYKNSLISNKQFPFIYFPSPYEEKDMGFDLWIEHFSHMEFHQYKRSDCFSRQNTKEAKMGLPKSFIPYYRFKLYDDNPSFQFTRLKTLASMFPQHKVYYVAPKFHKLTEFQKYFYKTRIVAESVFVDCNLFNSSSIKNYLASKPGDHVLAFNKSRTLYLFSEGIEIEDSLKYEFLNREGGRKSFEETVNKLVLWFNDMERNHSTDMLNEFRSNLQMQFRWLKTKLLIEFNINMIPIFNI